MREINLIGMKFGRLTVLRKSSRRFHWECLCDCGQKKDINGSNLRQHTTLSCGCYLKENHSALATKHGLSKSHVYKSWSRMKNRCTNPKTVDYKNYLGRGIRVCDRWMKFENFLEDMGIPEIGMSLDRIDNNGNYEPANCRWATARQQTNNRRGNRVIEFSGKKLTVSEWSREIGIRTCTLFARLKQGWSISRALGFSNA